MFTLYCGLGSILWPLPWHIHIYLASIDNCIQEVTIHIILNAMQVKVLLASRVYMTLHAYQAVVDKQ